VTFLLIVGVEELGVAIFFLFRDGCSGVENGKVTDRGVTGGLSSESEIYEMFKKYI
jgi:hypothetical protein